MSIESRIRRLESVVEAEVLQSQAVILIYGPNEPRPNPPNDGRTYLILPDNGRGHVGYANYDVDEPLESNGITDGGDLPLPEWD